VTSSEDETDIERSIVIQFNGKLWNNVLSVNLFIYFRYILFYS